MSQQDKFDRIIASLQKRCSAMPVGAILWS